GATASLDVSGSFHATTADSIKLQDGSLFSAIPGPSDSSLTASPPSAFGFLSGNVGSISITGSQLAAGADKVLSFVSGAGGVTVDKGDPGSGMRGAKLSATGGTINLISSGAGDVRAGDVADFGRSFEQIGTGGGLVKVAGLSGAGASNSTLSTNIS